MRYPDTPILEEAVRNHQDLQRKGQEQFMNDRKKESRDTMLHLEADATSGDAKVPPTSTNDGAPDFENADQDLNRLLSKDDTTDIITRRLLKRSSATEINGEKKDKVWKRSIWNIFFGGVIHNVIKERRTTLYFSDYTSHSKSNL